MDEKIGFAGLGNMGEPMAMNIVKAGFALTVYDVRDEPLRRLELAGASVARSPKELGEQCEIVACMVLNDAQMEEIALGNHGEGMLEAMQPNSIIVIHSTVLPKTCRRIAALAENRNVGVLDAPVSGAAMAAHQGKLSLIVGGDPILLERCRRLFHAVGSTIFHMGSLGMGEIAKLANNLIGISTMQLTREALRLARKAGIEEDAMLEVIKASTGNSWAAQNWQTLREIAQKYAGGADGSAQASYKDIALALAVGQDIGVALPVTKAVGRAIGSVGRKI